MAKATVALVIDGKSAWHRREALRATGAMAPSLVGPAACDARTRPLAVALSRSYVKLARGPVISGRRDPKPLTDLFAMKTLSRLPSKRTPRVRDQRRARGVHRRVQHFAYLGRGRRRGRPCWWGWRIGGWRGGWIRERRRGPGRGPRKQPGLRCRSFRRRSRALSIVAFPGLRPRVAPLQPKPRRTLFCRLQPAQGAVRSLRAVTGPDRSHRERFVLRTIEPKETRRQDAITR